MSQVRTRSSFFIQKESLIALLALLGIAVHLTLRFQIPEINYLPGIAHHSIPLLIVYTLGGIPLLYGLVRGLMHGEFGSDLLAGISIVVSLYLHEYLAGTLVVLMLSGGQALENYAVRSASSVLQELSKRLPSIAHRLVNGTILDVALDKLQLDDQIRLMPHESCPVDGMVLDGYGVMDESYLTGEPYMMSKAPGSAVFSGAINGETAITIRATHLPADSRYARIMEVMRTSEERRPRIRRLADQLGAWYTPIAVLIAAAAGLHSGDSLRFLAVLVVATPCPLLIAIPVAIIGSISLAARRGIIIKDPAILEKITSCRTAIFDKTGTLTYGQPKLTDILTAPHWTEEQVLTLAVSLERFSKHPLAGAIVRAGTERKLPFQEVTEICEPPGEGLQGHIGEDLLTITSRKQLRERHPELIKRLPPEAEGMECVVLKNGEYAAAFRFRDEPRQDSATFIRHLFPMHRFERLILLSGDRESEVRYLAETVGIREVYAGQTPEQKLQIVRDETKAANTVFMGDGINDAPALTAATIGIAFGQNSDITSEAAGAVILDTSLQKVDELLHISARMRQIALQSALGGMACSMVGMAFAANGMLSPVAGAILQEVIDIAAVMNALRVALPPKSLSDY